MMVSVLQAQEIAFVSAGSSGGDTCTNGMMEIQITVTAGGKTFKVSLYDNDTAAAFKSMLPLTITMTELNGNEKYHRLTQNLSVNATNPGTIHEGDILLWGSNTVVLFYKTFTTSYSYTRIGKLDNPEGLASALGNGNVVVIIELIE